MKCPKCGKEIADDSLFCEFCGTKTTLMNETHVLKNEENQVKRVWVITLLSVVILVLIGWLIYEHTIRNRISDSLKLYQEQAEAGILTIDSLQNIISQTDDKILLISDDNFEDFVSMSSHHLVIIDYYGKWCEPCRRLDPILYDLVKEYHNKLTVGRYIVDDFHEKYVKKFNVTGIPALIFLVNGEEKRRIVGIREETRDNIIETIENLINGNTSNHHIVGTFVDLGLPSGTLWKDENEEGLYTQPSAKEKFGANLPTYYELSELYSKCKWSVEKDRYKVIGPNGNSIYLPAAGNGSGEEPYNSYKSGNFGAYWSSREAAKENDKARKESGLGFYIADKYVFLWDFSPFETLSVRLVKR